MSKLGFLAMSAAAIALAGCGETKLLTRTLPDETRVVDGPSLALPPDYQLRPPREAADYETMLNRQKTAEAQALIVGAAAGTSATAVAPETNSGAVPASDDWLVRQTQQQGGITTDPNVRQTLEEETKQPEEEAKKGFWQGWFGGKSKDTETKNHDAAAKEE